jgi:hypothetical protein
MPRGVGTYIGVIVAASWVLGITAWQVQQRLPVEQQQWAGFILLPLLVVPWITVAILHRREASSGNAYQGLVWGPTAWYWLLYFGLLAYGALVAGALILIGGTGFDPAMTDYVQRIADMSAEQGNEIPAEAMGTLKISGWVTAVGVPLFGPWLGTVFAALPTFPLLGWLARRLLVKGRATTFLILAGLQMIVSASTALIFNPQQLDVPELPLRMGLIAVASAAGLPLMLWIFYRTRSVVLAVLAVQSYVCGYSALTPFFTDSPQWLSAPTGLAASVGSLLLGIALWVWKDPGGAELAVAGVAQDGTPLSPAMLAQAKAHQAQIEGEQRL